MRRRLAAGAACLGLLATSPVTAQSVAAGNGAALRALDRLSGELIDYEVPVGSQVSLGPLNIALVECRYPVANPAGDAFAYLLIDDSGSGARLFEGWMVASSPALNAFDHMRYDVWVTRCTSS